MLRVSKRTLALNRQCVAKHPVSPRADPIAILRAIMKAVFLDYATVSSGDLDSSALERLLPGLVLHDVTTEHDIAARIAGAQVVLLNKARLTRELIAGAKQLKLIALAATGTNNVDLDAARERGVAVCNI